MRDKILKQIHLIEKQLRSFNRDWLEESKLDKDPYRILVSCILSLRTKDATTALATQRLFRVADNPFKMLKLSLARIKELIYPVGFWRRKARHIKELSGQIIEDFGGEVPKELKQLLKLKGVGLKTANLVLGRAFGVPAICVDTHVHRISNRLGWVKTKNPLQTEKALREVLAVSHWVKINSLLVAFGQRICLPVSPFCSRCYLNNLCPTRGVKRKR